MDRGPRELGASAGGALGSGGGGATGSLGTRAVDGEDACGLGVRSVVVGAGAIGVASDAFGAGAQGGVLFPHATVAKHETTQRTIASRIARRR